MSEPFDPNKYLTKLSRRQRTAGGDWKTVELDYLEVKWRLLWLRQTQPEAVITTELLRFEPGTGGGLAICQAHITLPSGGHASGLGSETADDWKDYIEKAETKALGRALAALGFGTQFCEDFDFAASRGEKVVDAPVASRPQAEAAPAGKAPAPQEARQPMPQQQAVQAAAAGWQDRPATEPQVKAIYAIARGHGWTDPEIEEWVLQRFETTAGHLSRKQASQAIDALKLGQAS